MSTQDPAPSRSPAAAALRLALAALGLLLAGLAFSRYQALCDARAAATAWLQEAAPVDQRLARELLREPDADGVAVRAVRADLARTMAAAHGVDAGQPAGAAELRRYAARLQETAQRAGAALAARPASWEAAMTLGAATYLAGSFARDSRLFTAAERWEAPLAAALRLAPAKREPQRFLTSVYLEIWPALSPGKRAAARRQITGLLRDPEEMALFLAPWLDAAGSRREALAALPPEPLVWQRVQRLLAEHGDWQGLAEARAQWDRVLRTDLARELASADALLARGQTREARGLYLAIVERARPDLRYRDLLDAALTRCPPGPVRREAAERLIPQLDWALERCLVAECALQPDSLKRLAGFTGEAATPQEAMAVLLAGDMPRAVALERRSQSPWGEAWAPYLVLKAKALLARRELAAAGAALDLVHRSWWTQPTYWQARLELARATGDAAGEARAGSALAALTRRAWPATAWSWHRGRAHLEMMTAGPAPGFEVDLDEVPADGAVVELSLDGTLLGAFPAHPGSRFALALPLAGPRLHVLDLESVGGGRVLPGDVRLR